MWGVGALEDAAYVSAAAWLGELAFVSWLARWGESPGVERYRQVTNSKAEGNMLCATCMAPSHRVPKHPTGGPRWPASLAGGAARSSPSREGCGGGTLLECELLYNCSVLCYAVFAYPGSILTYSCTRNGARGCCAEEAYATADEEHNEKGCNVVP